MLLSISFAFAADREAVTVNATMALMKQGMNLVEDGFFYNDKAQIMKGIDIVENANNIFSTIDVRSFINQKNVSVQVVNNLTGHIGDELKVMKKSIASGEYSEASKEYSKILNNCISCHIVIRKW